MHHDVFSGSVFPTYEAPNLEKTHGCPQKTYKNEKSYRRALTTCAFNYEDDFTLPIFMICQARILNYMSRDALQSRGGPIVSVARCGQSESLLSDTMHLGSDMESMTSDNEEPLASMLQLHHAR